MTLLALRMGAMISAFRKIFRASPVSATRANRSTPTHSPQTSDGAVMRHTCTV
jgi:hypothetical protein